MNRERRKRLQAVCAKMEAIAAEMEDIKESLQSIKEEEEEALSNLPEGLQDSERGQNMQGYIDTLDDVVDSLFELDMDELHQKLAEIAEE